jgi:hypothetical protein
VTCHCSQGDWTHPVLNPRSQSVALHRLDAGIRLGHRVRLVVVVRPRLGLVIGGKSQRTTGCLGGASGHG